MTAYYSVTVRASPLFPFFFKESIHTFVSDVFQVLNHTQMVFGSVTLIECFKPAAGEVPAFITEPYKSLPDQGAMLFHENTVLATRQAAGAISSFEPFLVQVIL